MPNVSCGKNGQVKMQETAFLLIALTLLFVIVGLFFLSSTFSGLKETKAQLDEEKALLLVSKLAASPELSCENAFGSRASSCIDFDKAMVLKKYSNDYSKFWGVKNIEIIRIEGNISVECTNANYPNCGLLKIFATNNSGMDKSSFVSLCRKEEFHGTSYNKCEVARLMVVYE